MRDLPDRRDFPYAAPAELLRRLPSSVDLRRHCPRVFNQRTLHSCTAQAVGAAVEFDRRKQGLTPVFTPSRLFVYYNARALEGTARADSGAQIRNGIKSVVALGVCPEHLWPYLPARFRVKPGRRCYHDAIRHTAVSYHRLGHDLTQMKACLASGYPFVMGMTAYESFESPRVAKSGRVPMPHPRERACGNHAVLAVGYDEARRRFLVRNSWGPRWGLEGYFTLPYEYLTRQWLAHDFWTIRVVE